MGEVVSGWQIEQAISAWQSMRARLLANDPDLSYDEAALERLLGPEAADVRTIVGNLLTAVQHASSMADGAEIMQKDLRARQERYKRRVETMRATILTILDAIGQTSMEFPNGTVSMSKGRQVAIIYDEAALPDRFVRVVTTRSPDKTAILSALRDGEVIEGAELTNGIPSLTIRGK